MPFVELTLWQSPSRWGPLVHPSTEHNCPPPCLRHKPLLCELFPHPSWVHRRPPPCVLQYPPRWDCFEQSIILQNRTAVRVRWLVAKEDREAALGASCARCPCPPCVDISFPLAWFCSSTLFVFIEYIPWSSLLGGFLIEERIAGTWCKWRDGTGKVQCRWNSSIGGKCCILPRKEEDFLDRRRCLFLWHVANPKSIYRFFFLCRDSVTNKSIKDLNKNKLQFLTCCRNILQGRSSPFVSWTPGIHIYTHLLL